MTGVNSCDSIVTTNLTVLPQNTTSQTLTICHGQSVTVGSNIYTQSGTYKDTLTSATSCDSIVTTSLTVRSLDSVSQTITLCFGQSVTVGFSTYTASGTYNDTLTSVTSCDSIVTTNLTILAPGACDSSCNKPVAANDTSTNGYECNDVINVLANDTFQAGAVVTVIKPPLFGTDSVANNIVIYTPDGNHPNSLDSLVYSLCNVCGKCDTATVYIQLTQYPCNSSNVLPTPIAVDDNPNCTDTTGYINQATIINIFGNDTLYPANDTAILIIDSTLHGRLIINPNYTVTYIPDSGFYGNDNFRYQITETFGNQKAGSDTASVCINIIDPTAGCFFPDGISPDGDGINDVFVIPCSVQYPNASLLIFNRWGDRIWESVGGYKNDWGGTNLLGTPVADGTYYFIYQYNDGSGKSVARFVIVNR